jgi:hypothetical protein
MTTSRIVAIITFGSVAAVVAALPLPFLPASSSSSQEVRDHRGKAAPRRPAVRDHRTPIVQVGTFDCEVFRRRYTRDTPGRNFNFVSSFLAAFNHAPLVGHLFCSVTSGDGRVCDLTDAPDQTYQRPPVRFMFNVQGDCARFDFSRGGGNVVRGDGPGYSTYEVEMRRGGRIRWDLEFIAGPGRGGAIGNSLTVWFTAPTVTGSW